jgi:FkbM family methyltransferase
VALTNLNKALVPLALVLGMVCTLQFFQIKQLRLAADGSALSPELIAECMETVSRNLSDNQISAEALAPRLLDDRVEIEAYVNDFPVEDYEIVTVGGIDIQDQLYLDDTNDLIKNELRAGRVWEPHVVSQIIKYVRLGSTVLDIGAHIGAHTLYMSKLVGPAGKVYTFEPQRKIYRELYQNIKLNGAGNVVPMRYAAGDTNTIIEMNPSTDGNEGGTSVGEGGDRAELRTVDSFGFKNVSLMKIDVEHLEEQVLEGARQTIAESKPVLLVEIQGGYLLSTAPPEILAKKQATIKKIEDMGYAVIRFAPYDYVAIPK